MMQCTPDIDQAARTHTHTHIHTHTYIHTYLEVFVEGWCVWELPLTLFGVQIVVENLPVLGVTDDPAIGERLLPVDAFVLAIDSGLVYVHGNTDSIEAPV
jgi:hypothetical protein